MRSLEGSTYAYHISQDFGRMKQIVINVEDSAYECVLGILKLCQQVEVVSTEDLQGPLSDIDECFAKAIKELQDDKVIKNQYDYAFIYLAINEGIISGMEPFRSIRGYVEYLKELGVSNPPSKNPVSTMCKSTMGYFPDWFYDEPLDAYEELRRKNVVTRFSSAFTRAKRDSGH